MCSEGEKQVEEIGIITHYFDKVHAAAIKITKGSLKIGDSIQIKGHTTDIELVVNSMQVENQPIETANEGDLIGIEVKERVRIHDIVYKVLS